MSRSRGEYTYPINFRVKEQIGVTIDAAVKAGQHEDKTDLYREALLRYLKKLGWDV